MGSPFVIDQVSWHTNTPGNTETREHIVRRFCAVANFLDSNGLAVRQLACPESDITDSYNISSDDLSDDGLAVMKAAYDKWLQKVDNGMPPEDLTLLTRALNRIRSR